MKLTFSSIAIASFGFLSTTASAWTLDLTGADGRHVNTHGTFSAECNELDFTPAINVERAVFHSSFFVSFTPNSNPGHYCACRPNQGHKNVYANRHVLPFKTFELYEDEGCSGLGYRNDEGDWELTPARVIRSYAVR